MNNIIFNGAFEKVYNIDFNCLLFNSLISKKYRLIYVL